jgi:ankyrin repeat protein
MGNSADTLRMLLRAGAIGDSTDKPGRSALHWAAHCDAPLAAAVLAADSTVDLDAKDASGDTAMDVAREEVCRLLSFS